MKNNNTPVHHKLSEYLGKCRYHDVNYDIAKCLLDKIEEFPNITIYEIAFLAHTTAPTVTKFVKKMGYHSFKEFRTDLHPYSAVVSVDELTVQSFIEEDHAFTKSFLKEIDQTALKVKIADIMRYDTIVILNSSYSLPFSDQLRSMFEARKKKAYVLHRHSDQKLFYDLTAANGVIILISVSGRWLKENANMLEDFKQRHIAYYLICPKGMMVDEPVLPWVSEEKIFQSFYHSNRCLALLGKAIEYAFDDE